MPEETPSGPMHAPDDSERRTWWAIVAISAVLFVAIVLLGRPLVLGRLEAARNLDRATAMVAGTDGGLAEVDAAVRAVPASGGVDANEAVLSAIEDLRITVQEAETLSQRGVERLTTDEQQRAASVKAMAGARIEVLEAAERVLAGAGASGARREEARAAYDAAVEKTRRADAALVKL